MLGRRTKPRAARVLLLSDGGVHVHTIRFLPCSECTVSAVRTDAILGIVQTRLRICKRVCSRPPMIILREHTSLN